MQAIGCTQKSVLLGARGGGLYVSETMEYIEWYLGLPGNQSVVSREPWLIEQSQSVIEGFLARTSEEHNGVTFHYGTNHSLLSFKDCSLDGAHVPV